MHKIFGTKENAEYLDREGAYLVPLCNRRVGVIQTPKGYFFLGGGLENGESHLECMQRECLEEAGALPCVEGSLCSAEAYLWHPTIGHFHPIQSYYYGKLCEGETVPQEKDHVLCWVEYDQLRGKMFVEMQNWALEQLSVRMEEGSGIFACERRRKEEKRRAKRGKKEGLGERFGRWGWFLRLLGLFGVE